MQINNERKNGRKIAKCRKSWNKSYVAAYVLQNSYNMEEKKGKKYQTNSLYINIVIKIHNLLQRGKKNLSQHKFSVNDVIKIQI